KTAVDLLAQFGVLESGPRDKQTTQQWWNFVVRERAGGRATGQIQATIVRPWAEVAFLFGPAYWGQGFAAEAMAWLHERLSKDASVTECWATTVPENTRSIRLLQRLGYSRVAAGWPELASYDPGDLVFSRSLSPAPC
ncbi:MAG: GNAT family N-acetyltransferase, partial [Planctomycetaceae bacterium]|nr:GNAT family N-acetyltransferase [Planctomycetaceae bacterium]